MQKVARQKVAKGYLLLAGYAVCRNQSYKMSFSPVETRSREWFARDVTAAMLVVKNKSISLLWELNSVFM